MMLTEITLIIACVYFIASTIDCIFHIVMARKIKTLEAFHKNEVEVLRANFKGISLELDRTREALADHVKTMAVKK
jgi:hypothetical protein